MPIAWRLQRETNRSLLFFLLPLAFGLSLPHSLVPPHPGVIGAVQALGGADSNRVMIETILFGTLLCIPLMLIGWLLPGRWWAIRQFVTVPELTAPLPEADPAAKARSLTLALTIVLAPLWLSVLGFGSKLLNDLHVLADGREAIDFLTEVAANNRPRPDLILLDLNLPKVDGREVLSFIKNDARLRRIPVVILTTSSAEEDIARSYDMYANAYVTKPVDFEQFMGVVRKVDDFFLSVVRRSRD